MARIIILSDLGDHARHAAEHAVRVLGPDHEFTVLNAYAHMGLADPLVTGVAADVYSDTADQVSRWAGELRTRTGAKNMTGRVEAWPVSAAVRDIARTEGADLVVMGRRGTGAASVFGSTTTDVIRNAGVPVLVVPEDLTATKPGRILLANDHNVVNGDSLAMLRTMALHNGAKVLVVHIAREGDSSIAHADRSIYEAALQGVPLTFSTFQGADVPSALAEAATELGADMIAVLHRQRGFMDRLFNPSVARKLASECRLPLLVLEQQGDRS